ncbi:hypothetical protein ONE63_009461 [Megalurothrips usitatus]|uniref:MAM domain-containing protein n=1 Tax=Megalurothrips usitatus TaxID=439358 RepID=A0AAV7XRJ0_9NEOP|nr:hypothetical protein ONE63_009461 [Megalurothrips usitatus]
MLCEWTTRNLTGGQYLPRWEMGSGLLSNWIGGPPKDAGGGESTDKGGYAFFETSLLGSADARVASSATLESPPLDTTGAEGKCLTFSYAIDGLSASGLRVLLRPARIDGGPVGAERELWAARDSTGRQWAAAAVLYTFNTEHQVVFEGLARDASDPRRKFRGHVAVDDVALKPGAECRGHCTFEGGLCGWTNDEDDEFDWTLGRGSRNPSTGPATDRSSFAYGGLQGGYAYIDSSFPRRPGDMARLSSAELDQTGADGPLCLRFWTHMYGNGVGTLSVQLADTREEGHEQVLWTLSGESGNAWYQAQVTVASANLFRIVLVGRVGRNSLGDIAVDDISLSPGSCPTAPQVAASSRVDCTFEVDECGWVNVAPRERRDDMDWERVSGAGQRSQLRDHTVGSDKGSLMTLERSSVQRPGSRAWLTSEKINGSSQARCLSFWYVMNEPFVDTAGPSLGSLAVLVRGLGEANAGTPPQAVWRLYNNQGPDWKYAQVAITDSRDITLTLEGSWGSSRANGLIGIDDIAIFPGQCTTMPAAAAVRQAECHFERDTCSWSNETNGISPAAWRLASLARRPASLPDKTFGAPEGYIFFDLFAASKKGARDTARLVSPLIQASSDETVHCLTFWYAAFGVGDSAELRVIKADNSSGELVLDKVWELQSLGMDTAHPVWLPAQVALDAAQDFTLLLEGQAVNGGFAVDDITLSPGSCPIRPISALPKKSDDNGR